MTEKLHDWQKALVIKKDLVQLDVEKFIKALGDQSYFLLTKGAGQGAILRAAIEAGWILEPPCEVGDFEGKKRYFYDSKNVDEVHAGAVRWLGNEIDKAYKTATDVPKNL